MTSFSLSAFRDFCAAKPEVEVYEYPSTTPLRLHSDWTIAILRADRVVFAPPRTYGALTARLDALIEATP